MDEGSGQSSMPTPPTTALPAAAIGPSLPPSKKFGGGAFKEASCQAYERNYFDNW